MSVSGRGRAANITTRWVSDGTLCLSLALASSVSRSRAGHVVQCQQFRALVGPVLCSTRCATRSLAPSPVSPQAPTVTVVPSTVTAPDLISVLPVEVPIHLERIEVESQPAPRDNLQDLPILSVGTKTRTKPCVYLSRARFQGALGACQQ